MAKLNNLLMRKSQGKLAGATIYTTEGVTIMREVNEHPKNPRTDAQMLQRCKLGNLVNFYQALQPYWKKAFEKKEKLNSDYNRFVQLNLANSPVYLTKKQVADNVVVPADYIISQGSLPAINATTASSSSLNFFSGESMGLSANMTIAQFAAAVIATYPYLQLGDQLSFLVARKDTAGSVIREVTLTTSDTRTLASVLGSSFSITTSSITVSTGSDCAGAAVVVSRMVAGKLLVSSETMVSNINYAGSDYTSDEAKANAIKSYGGQGKVFLTPGE